MIGAGALKIDAGVTVDEGGFADNHGVEERGLRRRPQGVYFGDDAGVNFCAPEFEAVSGETGKEIDILGFSRGKRGDAVLRQVSFVIEGSGIMEVSRELELGGEMNALAVVEAAQGELAG